MSAINKRIKIPKKYLDVKPGEFTCEEYRNGIRELFELYQQDLLPQWAREMFEEMLRIARARKPN